MGMYKCNCCDRFFDDDEVVCHTDPKDELELICDDCYSEKEAENEMQNLPKE